LARSRYLFIKQHRPRFGGRVLAELRGVMDQAGNSPFWDALAGRFFGMSFPRRTISTPFMGPSLLPT
jgi:arginine N-succinyltransferase